jgi:hypothetical protein
MPEENKETQNYTEQDLKISVLCAALANKEEGSEGYNQYKKNLETVLDTKEEIKIKAIYKKESLIIIGYVVETNTQAIVAFRGTKFSRVSEVRNDLNNNTSTLTLSGNEYKVHEGFKTEYELCRDSLQENIKDINKPIIFTGHSLGGALATFAALDHHHQNKEIKNVITYGAPKSFHADSVEQYNESLGKKTLRIEQKFDPATKYPFSKAFKAVGQKISMHAGSFYHISPTNVHKGNMYRKLVNKIKQENLDSLNASEQESRSIESYISAVMEYCKEKVRNMIVRPQNTPKKKDNAQKTAVLSK